ncbi:MAG: hypothetical protein QOJ31_2154 [Gaiellales bacterium]|jgi:hypothetical protein|nr:hypothetical protein [Gaiellales bacterium]MDX6544385.1 hypothetical protein [Gaiellales bacterium]MDX6551470.1 hypothetical protein [Gaiellales bacterium]
MKKLLTLMLAGFALALPAVALADTCMLTHLGAKVSSRKVTGSCMSRKLILTSSLLMRCDTATGYAVARYDFAMPRTWAGTASPVVDAVGDHTSSLVYLDATHVRVVVRTSGPSKVVIAAVSVGFYN